MDTRSPTGCLNLDSHAQGFTLQGAADSFFSVHAQFRSTTFRCRELIFLCRSGF